VSRKKKAKLFLDAPLRMQSALSSGGVSRSSDASETLQNKRAKAMLRRKTIEFREHLLANRTLNKVIS